MKKLLMFCSLIVAVSALEANIIAPDPALNLAKQRFNRSDFNFKDFTDALTLAEANIDKFTPEERQEFVTLQKKAINMIDKSINIKDPVRSEADIRDAANFHLGEAIKANNEGDEDRAKYHLNEHFALNDQLPKYQPLEMRDYRPSYAERQRQTRKASEDEGWDLVEDTGR